MKSKKSLNAEHEIIESVKSRFLEVQNKNALEDVYAMCRSKRNNKASEKKFNNDQSKISTTNGWKIP